MSAPTDGLTERARGWLRFLWDKATTPDDWSSGGEPHAWWDRVSTPPMCAFPRFDLWDTSYALPVMAEATPAWREVYARIARELVERHTTFWAAIDWLTLIGPDPGVDRYPPEWQIFTPAPLQGRYPLPGWTANGVEPWGLQPDPIGADGFLGHRGFFDLLLGVYRYLSGDDRWDRPFSVSGYQDRAFSWTHPRIAELVSAQMAARPQGPHCENTKIWPLCVSGAGLGLQLYDALHGTALHAPYHRWVEFARAHYMRLTHRGELDWFALYYDPIEERVATVETMSAYFALIITPYVYPQQREFAELLYELAVHRLAWDNPSRPVLQLVRDPRFLAAALFMARELGDTTTEARLRTVAEHDFEPRFFGAEQDRFAFWFGLDSPWPRGQLNAMMMLSECGPPGAWWRVFNEPNHAMHDEPTVRDVDYPALGIVRARNDVSAGSLEVETVAATPSRRGDPTRFTVDRLPDPAAVRLTIDGQDFSRWRVTGPDSIEIEADIGEHVFRLVVGQRHSAPPGREAPSEARSIGAPATSVPTPPVPIGVAREPANCSCCASPISAGPTRSSEFNG